MLKTAASLSLALLLAGPCHAADSAFTGVDGVWEDVRDSGHYYSIHTDGDKIVLVDLRRIEQTGSTLKSAQSGKLGDDFFAPLTLTQLAPEYPDLGYNNGGYLRYSLQFISPTHAMYHSICEVCSVVLFELRKKF